MVLGELGGVGGEAALEEEERQRVDSISLSSLLAGGSRNSKSSGWTLPAILMFLMRVLTWSPVRWRPVETKAALSPSHRWSVEAASSEETRATTSARGAM